MIDKVLRGHGRWKKKKKKEEEDKKKKTKKELLPVSYQHDKKVILWCKGDNSGLTTLYDKYTRSCIFILNI